MDNASWRDSRAARRVLGGKAGPLLGCQGAGSEDDAPLRNRGGTNPNAPYTTVDHSAHLVKRPPQMDVNAADYCAAGDLTLFESGAHVDGQQRSVRLNLVNHGKEPAGWAAIQPSPCYTRMAA